ncbi:MAG: arsenosugar biosynthesis radical SAM protein ArsS [Magnetococcales bacterium]|nr:arsenosugar biosynthesis radical SAM protein ArsS [Magnetococcales bacterium]
MNVFLYHVEKWTGCPELRGRTLETLQVNLGLRCTLECHHCHLGASPRRKETMSGAVMDRLLEWLRHAPCKTVDITGGAPELHPRLRPFIAGLRGMGIDILLRTNLAVMTEPEQEELPRFLADMGVHLIGSLPCYLERNVDAQRGTGTFRRSLEGIRRLNRHGYGLRPNLPLTLVYNPAGPFLPPDQCKLEQEYRRILQKDHGLSFSRLIAMANMPIGRFGAMLRHQGEEKAYLTTLERAFNPHTLEGLMCRNQISVRWDGQLFDCDFNLALDMPVNTGSPGEARLDDALADRLIVTGNHCLACTAGAGSSCSGALAA